MGDFRDKCPQMVANPDSPFCVYCENAGHPDLSNQKGREARLS